MGIENKEHVNAPSPLEKDEETLFSLLDNNDLDEITESGLPEEKEKEPKMTVSSVLAGIVSSEISQERKMIRAKNLLALAPEGWEYQDLPENVSVNGKEESVYSSLKGEQLYNLLNSEYINDYLDKGTEKEYVHNRLFQFEGHFTVPYNHYKLEDLKKDPGFQEFSNAISGLVSLQNAPLLELDHLKEKPQDRAKQKTNFDEVVVRGHASPLAAGEDPYEGGEIIATLDNGTTLTGNEALAYKRALAGKELAIEQGIPEGVITLKYSAHTKLPEIWNGSTEVTDGKIPTIGLYVLGAHSLLDRDESKTTTNIVEKERPNDSGGVGIGGLDDETISAWNETVNELHKKGLTKTIGKKKASTMKPEDLIAQLEATKTVASID